MGVGGQRHAPAVLPPGKTQYPMFRRLDGPQGRYGRVRKVSLPIGIRSPHRPARSESLYWPSYSCPGVNVDNLNSLVACDIQSVTVNAASQRSSGRRKQFEHCIGTFRQHDVQMQLLLLALTPLSIQVATNETKQSLHTNCCSVSADKSWMRRLTLLLGNWTVPSLFCDCSPST